MRKFTIFVIMILAVSGYVTGQDTVVMLQTGIQTIRLAPGESVCVLDPGGNEDYPGNCDTRLNIISDSGTAIRIHGWVSLDSPNDVVGIFDYRQDFFHNVVSRSGTDPIDVVCHSSVAIIYCWTNTYIHNRGFGLTVTAYTGEESSIHDVRVDSTTATTATISWHDSSPAMEWTVKYGVTPAEMTNEINTHSETVTLTGLRPHKTYFFKIFNNRTYMLGDTIERVHHFATTGPPPVECIPFDNLESEWVTCKYGECMNPDRYEGIVDYDGDILTSRHTVCRDTSARDPYTDMALRTIPEGFSTSVRLGNSGVEAKQESITYEYIVDTSVTSLLILRYAAVLEDPGHTSTNQPMFKFDVYDIYELPIDSRCYSACFVADSTLGWNTVTDSVMYIDDSGSVVYYGRRILWKDWTAVGIDLAPLHGQTIFIKFSTYDCAQGGHFGYAYFVLECGNKAVRAENCGEAVENIFTAPDGFSYRWYEMQRPDITLSDSQSVVVTTMGDYICTLGFVGEGGGANIDATSYCTFDISASSGYRYPMAAYEVRIEGSDDCNSYVRLVNRSQVTSDLAHQHPLGQSCEAVWWMVDGPQGESAPSDTTIESSQLSPLLLLPPGLHHLTMVAILSHGLCTDTIRGTFWLPNPCDDTLYAHVCEGTGYRLFDTTVYAPGIYIRDSDHYHRTLILEVGHSYDTIAIRLEVDESLFPFRWGGETFTAPVENHIMNLRDRWGCDSIVIVDVVMVQITSFHIDTFMCQSQLPLLWGDTLISDAGIYIRHFVNRWGLDSIVELQLIVLPDKEDTFRAAICKGTPFTWIDGITYYHATTQPQVTLTASNGCDSLIHLILVEEAGIEAKMSITPRIADYEHNIVTLRDETSASELKERHWYLSGGAAYESHKDGETITFQFPPDEDSVEVMLVVASIAGCVDTAVGVVLADHAVVWAPNAFTPDEETNSVFRIFGHELMTATATIYTRQGLRVTTFDALREGWDGTYQGTPCPQAAYVWKLEYTTQAQPRQTRHAKDCVLLLR